ncbi:MAG TPA: hypothetical protein VK788_06885 [Terriglobales bacterium]|nr:hypothetical protein [Terriglobales bacterium]
MPSLSSRPWSRNQNQLTAVQFAPAANIAVARLEEKDWTVMLVMPIHRRNCPLPGVDLNKRESAAKFNVDKIKPQDLAGAGGPLDEDI